MSWSFIESGIILLLLQSLQRSFSFAGLSQSGTWPLSSSYRPGVGQSGESITEEPT